MIIEVLHDDRRWAWVWKIPDLNPEEQRVFDVMYETVEHLEAMLKGTHPIAEVKATGSRSPAPDDPKGASGGAKRAGAASEAAERDFEADREAFHRGRVK